MLTRMNVRIPVLTKQLFRVVVKPGHISFSLFSLGKLALTRPNVYKKSKKSQKNSFFLTLKNFK